MSGKSPDTIRTKGMTTWQKKRNVFSCFSKRMKTYSTMKTVMYLVVVHGE